MKTQWPADKVERRPLSSLVPAARNARTHSPEQVAQLAASIREWGWTVPVLVDEGGGLIAGHGRVLAAAELGLTSVPTMVAAGWSEAQVRAYRIADNKLAMNAGWDDGLLRLELGELRGLEVDLGLLGFGAEELDALFAPSAGLTDPDDAPEPPVRPVSVLGDVWVMGRHRLVCGDSTDAAIVALALNGDTPVMVLTDPPYGIGYDYDEHDDRNNEINAALVASAFTFAPNVRVWTPGPQNIERDISRFGRVRMLIWAKGFAASGNGLGGASTWEPVFVVGHTPARRLNNDVLEIKTDRLTLNGMSLGSLHPCPKPAQLFVVLAEALTNPGQAVYDPFVGSGTTIIAAEMTGRACHAIELSPAYVDVAVRRWQAFTGEEATLESDGRSFAAVAEERVPFDADADSIGSYNAAVAAVGKRVKAGTPVPAFFLKQQQGA